MNTPNLRVVVAAVLLGTASTASASDHADPIDPLGIGSQEGGLTGLFVFPVLADGSPAFPYQRTSNLPLHDPLADVAREPLTKKQQGQIKAIVFILCLHRALAEPSQLNLRPYTYKIHIDRHSNVVFPSAESHPVEEGDDAVDPYDADGGDHDETDRSHRHDVGGISVIEAYARYGGSIADPTGIRPDYTMEFRLDDDLSFFDGYPQFPSAWGRESVETKAGVFDDPFIFPLFFRTNVVSIAVRVPIECFPEDRTELLVWATSHKGSGQRQIDHVGRSGRTQNPRFDLLNTLPPRQHVAALQNEHESPGLIRDIQLRLNLASLFAYRKWDFAPDVVCFSTRYPVGFPNGRLLTDDVAAILAQHGDTLLYELSYQDNNYSWPRQTRDSETAFRPDFPYLRDAIEQPERRPPPRLSAASVAKLILIVLALSLLLAVSHLTFAILYHRRKVRRRYL